MEHKSIKISDDINIGTRIDMFLASVYSGFSRSHIQKIIDIGNVIVNDKAISKNYKLKKNDVVVISFPEPDSINIIPQNIPLDIIFEDDDIIVINKQKGLVVHPAPGHSDGTLVNALMYHCENSLSGINGIIRPGIVHRIDKDTSGLLIIAKNDLSHINLAEQLKDHKILREYHAILHGIVKDDNGTINFPIGRDKKDRKKMAVSFINSKTAITHFEVLKRYDEFTYVKFILETGRTHQIRVHASYIGHPIAGDSVYGYKKYINNLNGQCLHAKSISFTHPKSKKLMFFDTLLPNYFVSFLKKISF